MLLKQQLIVHDNVLLNTLDFDLYQVVLNVAIYLLSCTSSRRFSKLLLLAVNSCNFCKQLNSTNESKLLPLTFRIS